MKKIIKRLLMVAGLPAMLLFAVLNMTLDLEAAEIPGLENNRFVTLSPDGKAFTIGYGDKTAQNYSYSEWGKTVNIRNTCEQTEPGEGEHIYKKLVSGAVTVGYWKLEMCQGRCIHSIGADYRINSLNLMGANASNCYRNYNAGWIPYCAVCGEKIANIYFYMTENMATETKYLPSGISSATYFYLCPYDNSLENHNYINHTCTKISTNRYTVKYFGAGDDVAGNMDSDTFYYEPGKDYEGTTVSAKEQISKCEFTRENYVFAGWSITEDGDAVISDEENWMQVREITDAGSMEDNSVIKLYAVWKKNEEGIKNTPNEETEELKLDADIERLLYTDDGEVSFLPGESGDLKITVSGEPDKVVVEFPEGLEAYDCVFEYSGTAEGAENEKIIYECIRFMVPLGGISDDTDMMTVKVSAYRDDECVIKYPVLMLRGGSIFDGLRTSLR